MRHKVYRQGKWIYRMHIEGRGKRYDEIVGCPEGWEHESIGKWEFLLSEGIGDYTPRHDHDDYDPNCSACWLNYGHTEAKHQKSITS